MSKYIRGTYKLQEYVADMGAFEAEYDYFFEELILWANQSEFALAFGGNDDKEYLCSYKIVRRTKKECKEIEKKLKNRLKDRFPKLSLVLEVSGEQW